MTKVSLAVRSTVVMLAGTVTTNTSLVFIEVLKDSEHHVWSDNTLHACPFIVIVNVLIPAVSVNFKESGETKNIDSRITGSLGVGSESLQEEDARVRKIETKMNRMRFITV